MYFKDFQPQHRIDRFLPNGDIEIIIDLKDRPQFVYDNANFAAKQSVRHLWFSGIRTGYISIPSGYESEQFILFFRKGMAKAFLRLPMHQVHDTILEGDVVLQRVFWQLRQRLLECLSVEQMFTVAETVLTDFSRSAGQTNAAVTYAVSQILQHPHLTRINQLGDQIGYSPKHFIALFKEHVGLSPKAFLRIMRFQQALREIELTQTVQWSQVALAGGYYDQSHFIADFKHFSGFTPNDYLAVKGEEINYIPVQ